RGEAETSSLRTSHFWRRPARQGGRPLTNCDTGCTTRSRARPLRTASATSAVCSAQDRISSRSPDRRTAGSSVMGGRFGGHLRWLLLPTLIRLAFAFEQATRRVAHPRPLRPSPTDAIGIWRRPGRRPRAGASLEAF